MRKREKHNAYITFTFNFPQYNSVWPSESQKEDEKSS